METTNIHNKKPIAPTLKSMSIGASEEFPTTKVSSVRATIQTLQTEMQVVFKTRKNKAENTISVTRVA